MTRLAALTGLGPSSERMLTRAGISTAEDLERLGAVRSYHQVERVEGSPPSLNLLWALEGALLGVHWTSLQQSQKARLLLELDGLRELDQLFDSNPD